MEERTIKHLFFTHSVEDPDSGRLIERDARQGETVELREEDIERGERHGAFVTEADEAAVSPEGLAALTDEQLAEWLEDEQPNVKETVEASGGDPDLARRLLDAEQDVSGGDPREGVVKGLARVIERA